MTGEGTKHFEKICPWQKVIQTWIPSLEKIQDLKSLQDQYISDIKKANEERENEQNGLAIFYQRYLLRFPSR